jgi:hypothetical protein
MEHDLKLLRYQCPLPVLMNRLGLARFARNCCASPFRSDHHASWGIFLHNGRWLFKDFATDECGDEIKFLAKLNRLDPKQDFFKLLDLYADLAASTGSEYQLKLPIQKRCAELPDQLFLNSGTPDQLRKLSELRKISFNGLHYAHLQGVLQFGKWHEWEVYAVTDQSGYLGEIRRLNGQDFPGSGRFESHKSHTLRLSRKNWPLGILEAAGCGGLALVEGMPDFLALHQFIIEEGLSGRVGSVAMLTSSCDIGPDALPHFAGKNVRIFPHNDGPGIAAAEGWQKQLLDAGAKRVDFFNFQACEAGAIKIKDLCDFNQQRGSAGYQQQHILENLAL